MATWSADAKDVPADVRAALDAGRPPSEAFPEGPADAYVHVRAGLDSLLGDTHLILSRGKLRIASRGTSLDPLTEAVLTGPPTLDDSGYRNVLEVPTAAGMKRLEVTALEEDAVEDLLAALTPDATPSAPNDAAGPTGDAEESDEDDASEEGADEDDGGAPLAAPRDDATLDDATLDQARKALVGALRGRVQQRRAELLAKRSRRRVGNVEVTLGQRRPPEERWRARHRHRHGSVSSQRPAEVVPARTPADTFLRLVMLAVAAAAVFGLFATLGKLVGGAR